MSGADGAYDVLGHVLVPDFAYKPTHMSDDYPDPVAPLWAVEVISPKRRAFAASAKSICKPGFCCEDLPRRAER